MNHEESLVITVIFQSLSIASSIVVLLDFLGMYSSQSPAFACPIDWRATIFFPFHRVCFTSPGFATRLRTWEAWADLTSSKKQTRLWAFWLIPYLMSVGPYSIEEWLHIFFSLLVGSLVFLHVPCQFLFLQTPNSCYRCYSTCYAQVLALLSCWIAHPCFHILYAFFMVFCLTFSCWWLSSAAGLLHGLYDRMRLL